MTEKAKTPRLVVIIIVHNYWGKGETIQKAWNQVTKVSGRSKTSHKREGYCIRVVPETDDCPAYLDEMSCMHWADVEGMQALELERHKI